MRKVLIICNQGMSSSLMAKKTTNFFKEQGEDIQIDATTIAVGDKPFQNDEYDLILISPQVRMKYDEFAAKAEKNNKKIAQIGFDAYAPIKSGIENMAKLIQNNL